MAWKTINGRRYYYKSERSSGRVKSTYFGAGESGSLMAEMVALERLERAADREEHREQREEFMAEETVVSEWFDGVQAVADAAMIAAGFHKHKGQMAEETDMSEVATQTANPPAVSKRKPPAPGPETDDLVKRAAKGDKSCLPAVRALLADGDRGESYRTRSARRPHGSARVSSRKRPERMS